MGINASEVKNIPSHLETHSPLNIADVSLQTQPFKDEGRRVETKKRDKSFPKQAVSAGSPSELFVEFFIL